VAVDGSERRIGRPRFLQLVAGGLGAVWVGCREQRRGGGEGTAAVSVPRAGTTRALEPAGIPLVYVPAGTFLMGSTDAEVDAALELCVQYQSNCERSWFTAEQPQHQVRLGACWIGQTEVTNAQYRTFIQAGGYAVPEYWTAEGWQWRERHGVMQPEYWADELWNAASHPVVGVSWYEAAAFAHWAGARLPTEAEWERAARDTLGSRWPWGQEWEGSKANFCDRNCDYPWKDERADDGYRYTSPVGSYGRGASPCGALDLAGNVWEWVADWYAEQYCPTGTLSVNPTGCPSGRYRVIRGGAWNFEQYALRCATRGRLEPDNRSSALGLRVVVSAQ
jgi:formylglycine-generating enzyme required for sulfatase activity